MTTAAMTTAAVTRRTRTSITGARRLVRSLEHQRRTWSRGQDGMTATERAWNAGIAEGLRLAQLVIRKGV